MAAPEIIADDMRSRHLSSSVSPSVGRLGPAGDDVLLWAQKNGNDGAKKAGMAFDKEPMSKSSAALQNPKFARRSSLLQPQNPTFSPSPLLLSGVNLHGSPNGTPTASSNFDTELADDLAKLRIGGEYSQTGAHSPDSDSADKASFSSKMEDRVDQAGADLDNLKDSDADSPSSATTASFDSPSRTMLNVSHSQHLSGDSYESSSAKSDGTSETSTSVSVVTPLRNESHASVSSASNGSPRDSENSFLDARISEANMMRFQDQAQAKLNGDAKLMAAEQARVGPGFGPSGLPFPHLQGMPSGPPGSNYPQMAYPQQLPPPPFSSHPHLPQGGQLPPRPDQGPYQARSNGPAQLSQRSDDLQVNYALQQAQRYGSTPDNGARGLPAGIAGAQSIGQQVPQILSGHGRRDPSADFGVEMNFGNAPNALSGGLQSGGLPSGYPPPAFQHNIGYANPQQLYDLVLPPQDSRVPASAVGPATRGQFRPTHNHSVSDPASLRDAATLALIGNRLNALQNATYPQILSPQAFSPALQTPGGYSPASTIYQGYYPPDSLSAEAWARLQVQYSPASPGLEGYLDQQGILSNGPSANNRKLGLYKTELCRSWEEKGSCRYGPKCQFAHGEDEIRKVARHPKYKTEICRTFWVSGSCPYGKRCCFIHTELPTAGAPGAAPPSNTSSNETARGPTTTPGNGNTDGRARSMSTNSDPNDPPSSLLARINAKARGSDNANAPSTRSQEPFSGEGQYGGESQPFSFGRPPSSSLRVDTSDGSNINPPMVQTATGYTFGGQLPQRISPASAEYSGHSRQLSTMSEGNRMDIANMMAQQRTNQGIRQAYSGNDGSRGRGQIGGGNSPSSFGKLDGGPSLTPSRISPAPPSRGMHARGDSTSSNTSQWGNNIPRQTPISATFGGHETSSPWSSSDFTLTSGRVNERAWS